MSMIHQGIANRFLALNRMFSENGQEAINCRRCSTAE